MRPQKMRRLTAHNLSADRRQRAQRSVENLERRLLFAAGDVDTTFGVSGLARADVAATLDEARDVAVQADGKLVAVGSASTNNNFGGDFAVARFNVNGTLDTTFGTGGTIRADFGDRDGAESLALQTDGKIVVGGWTGNDTNFDYKFALARYNPDGTPDTTFGAGGRVLTNLSGGSDKLAEIALVAGGKILAAGTSQSKAALVRYNADGSPDTTFGSGAGTVVYAGSASVGKINRMALQPDGKIVLAGDGSGGNGFISVGLLRYTAAGQLDTTFGTGGALNDSVGVTSAQGLAIGPTGTIYVAAAVSSQQGQAGTYTTKVFSYHASSGAKLTNFGVGGSVTVAQGGWVGDRLGMQVTDAGIYVAGGGTSQSSTWTLTRITPAGSLDYLWGNQGSRTITSPLLTTGARVFDLALDAGGRIVAAGYNDWDMALVRFAGGNNPFGSVSGSTFNDANGNGAFDVPDHSLAGVKVYADLDNDGTLDPTEPFATSDLGGAYKLSVPPGSYNFRAAYPAGYVSSFPASGVLAHTVQSGFTTLATRFGAVTTGRLFGNVFNDRNANGVRDTGEANLGSQQVYVDLDNDGTRDAGEPAATTDAVNGAFRFDLNPGTYAVRLATAAGWEQTLPTGGAAVVAEVVGNGGSQALFGTRDTEGAVSGVVFDDRYGDGVRETSDAVVPNRTVYIDRNLNRQLDAGEPTATTDAKGVYTFADLPGGVEVTLRTVLPGDTVLTTPADARTVTPQAGTTTVGNDFGTFTRDVVEGIAYHDRNGNRRRDIDEPAMPGVPMNHGGGPTFTAADGTYRFAVGPGQHNVYATTPPGYTGGGSLSFPAASGSRRRVDQPFHNTTRLLARVMHADAAGNSLGVGLAGQAVYVDVNENGVLEANEPRNNGDEHGYVAFMGLQSGRSYLLRAVVPAGYTSSSSENGIRVTVGGTDPLPVFYFYSATVPKASVSGRVWNDADADGVADLAELPAAGWAVYHDANNNRVLDGGERSTVADNSGFYVLGAMPVGTHAIRVDVPPGWRQTYPADGASRSVSISSGSYGLLQVDFTATPQATIGGVVYDDRDGDGTRDAGEPGIAGRTVFLDADNDALYDEGAEPARTTDANGAYLFGVAAGGYNVRAVSPFGWSQTAPANNGGHSVAPANGQAATADFGSRANPARVYGTVHHDVNGDGTRQAVDTGIAGRTVFADLDNDGAHGAGEPAATTASDGLFILQLAPGTYTLRSVVPAGWTLVSPAANGGAYPLTLGAGDVTRLLHFGHRAAGTGVLGGVVFHDVDADAARDAGEPPLAGRTVFLDFDEDAVLDAGERVATTDAEGRYAFTGMPAGRHVLRQVVPATDWVASAPAAGATGGAHAVDLAAGQSSSALHFGTAGAHRIQVFAFDDRNGDGGYYHADESLLAGRTIYVDVDGDGVRDPGEPGVVSDAASVTATSLYMPSGTHLLRQVVPAGWRQTRPADGQGLSLTTGTFAGAFGFGSTLVQQAPVVARAAADAYVRDGSYAGTNFGGAAELVVKRSTTSGNTRETHLRFSIAQLEGIAGAKLRLFGRSTTTQAVGLTVRESTNVGWSEGGITWNAKPAPGLNVGGATRLISGTAGQWHEWDLTSYVQQRKAAGATEIGLVLSGEFVTDAQAVFNSEEAAANRPELVLTPGTPQQGIIVSPTSLSVPEGTTRTYGVRLAAQPASDVIVSAFRLSGDADLNSGGSLLFTRANWNVTQSMQITAAEDADGSNGTATFRFNASGLPIARDVTATEVDNDSVTPVTLRAKSDAYVRDGSYAGTNYGAAAELQLKKSGTAGSTREFYLHFDLSSASASVASAKLRLWGRIDSATQAPQVSVFPIASTILDESTVTWNNRPQTGTNYPVLASAVVSGSTARWYEFDLTSFIAGEKAVGRNTATLLVRSMANTDPYLIFNSDEAAANQPELVVTPAGGTPPPPPPIGILVSKTQMSVAEGGTGTFTVRLSARPAREVILSVGHYGGDADVSVASPAAPTPLYFDPTNWDVPQTVTIAAAQDADATNGTATIVVEQPTMIEPKFVTVTEADDDGVTPGPVTTLRAVVDAYARDGSYATTNFGTTAQLQVKKAATGWNRESFLRFDLTSLTSVSSAKLRLFGRLDNTTTASLGFGVYASTDTAWGETTLNWNNRPQSSATLLASGSVAGITGKWYELDLTAFLKQQKAAGAASVTLVLKAAVASDATLGFDSDESANRPELVVTA